MDITPPSAPKSSAMIYAATLMPKASTPIVAPIASSPIHSTSVYMMALVPLLSRLNARCLLPMHSQMIAIISIAVFSFPYI
ncbi:MAG: hypothetical protein HN948_01980 [Clostridia bacterium]|nr:hypothetical protein [Clostridia bacterium]